MKTRSQIVSRAKQHRAEIAQIFIDCQHWNSACRKPGVAPIDADPDGQLKRLAEGLDKMLASEKVTVFKCLNCDQEIQFDGKFWEHVGDTPRHQAELANDV